MTKEQEIQKLREFVESLPGDSYLAGIFEGVTDYIEYLIQNDFGCNLTRAIEDLVQQKKQKEAEIQELQAKKKEIEAAIKDLLPKLQQYYEAIADAESIAGRLRDDRRKVAQLLG